jgi:hypothetical protein
MRFFFWINVLCWRDIPYVTHLELRVGRCPTQALIRLDSDYKSHMSALLPTTQWW